MQNTSEPSKPFKGSAGVRIEKIRIRHLTEHFELLFKPYLSKLKKSTAERYRSVQIYINKNRQTLLRAVLRKMHKSINFSEVSASIAVIVITITFAHYALAASSAAKGFFAENESAAPKEEEVEVLYEPMEAAYSVEGTSLRAANVPLKNKKDIISNRIQVPITAYSSTPDQTDGSPFITASGTRVRDGIVAANFLPIGTKIRIPEYYGDKIFVVEDRMNARYWKKVDIWMPTRSQALRFGLRSAYIEVIEEI